MWVINKERLRWLCVCFPQGDYWVHPTRMDHLVDDLESVSHELGHVLVATGDFVLFDEEVDQIATRGTFFQNNFDEMRTTAVVRWAFIRLGLMTPEIELKVVQSMFFNIDDNDFTRYHWPRIATGKRNYKLGLRLADFLCSLGIVEDIMPSKNEAQ